MMFSGSYASDDVTFLLKPVELAPTDVALKERLIQSGQRHYSEMISREALPSPAYLRVFHEALGLEKDRFARDLRALAHRIARDRPGHVTIVSLARAGTPIGVLLARALRRLGRSVHHYSVSIIRDRGLDRRAMAHILEQHPPESVVFVDGWTGKGVIAGELQRSVADLALPVDPGLYVVADLCGAAACAASCEDYLIPSGVLGATVSGLVSRSILNDAVVGPGDFHGCLYYEQFARHDLSRWFVAEVDAAMVRQAHLPPAPGVPPHQRQRLRATSEQFLAAARRRFDVRSVHHVKPGIGEATRVLLRRVPACVLLRDVDLPAVAHLRILALEKGVPIVVDPALPYAAAAIIQELDR